MHYYKSESQHHDDGSFKFKVARINILALLMVHSALTFQQLIHVLFM